MKPHYLHHSVSSIVNSCPILFHLDQEMENWRQWAKSGLFFYSYKLRTVFIFLIVGKIKRIIFCDMWKWYRIQITVLINEILLEYIWWLYLVCVLSVAAFSLQWQSLVVAAETIGYTSLKYFLPGFLQKMFANS